MSLNVLTPITDVDEKNGGTLLIPGSHLIISEAMRAGTPVGKLPPAINLDARNQPALFELARLLAATEPDEAQRLIDRATALPPNPAPVLNDPLARVMHARAESVGYLRQALEHFTARP